MCKRGTMRIRRLGRQAGCGAAAIEGSRTIDVAFYRIADCVYPGLYEVRPNPKQGRRPGSPSCPHARWIDTSASRISVSRFRMLQSVSSVAFRGANRQTYCTVDPCLVPAWHWRIEDRSLHDQVQVCCSMRLGTTRHS